MARKYTNSSQALDVLEGPQIEWIWFMVSNSSILSAFIFEFHHNLEMTYANVCSI